MILFNGKRIAVLGARGVGKTQLIHFMSTGDLPKEHQQTTDPQKSSERRFHVDKTEIAVKDIWDVPGSKDSYAQWRQQAEQADLVMYLFRADLFITGDSVAERRAISDLTHINQWLDGLKKRPKLFLVGTHCDLDQSYGTRVAANAGDYIDEFRKLYGMVQLSRTCGSNQQFTLVLGSLLDISSTSALVGKIFQQAAL